MAIPIFIPGAAAFNAPGAISKFQKGEIGNGLGELLGFDVTPGFNVKKPSNANVAPSGSKSTNPTEGLVGIQDLATSAVGAGGSIYGAGGGGSSTYDPQAVAYYDDQISKANNALGRLDAQQSVGNSNIANAYQAQLNTLLGSNARAERDYATKKQTTIDDNVAARAKVDANVARQSQNLARLLGNSSSAALFAAPLAVARQGTEQQNTIGTAFNRNLGSLLTADEDRKRDFENARTDLGNQRTQSERSFRADIEDNRASILEQLQGLATAKGQAAGQNYSQARQAGAGYGSRVDSILNKIAELGRNPTITARDVSFTAPNLDAYTSQDIAASLGQNPAASQAGQYANLLGVRDEDERRRLI